MYQPLFREERLEVMHQLMQTYPLATLVTSQNNGLAADHLPLILHPEMSPNGTLHGHFSKGNPLWRTPPTSREALLVFQGPQTYVTPSWYPSKQEHGKVVPTWNYACVHARGTIEFIEDPKWLLQHLMQLTSAHENHRTTPWKVSDAPTDFIARQLKGIVGIQLQIESLEGTWKMSQNRPEQDIAGVLEGLQKKPNTTASDITELVKSSIKA